MDGDGSIAEGWTTFVAVVTFVTCWIYAISAYGWFLGLAFGWIPALIIAAIAGLLAVIVGWLLLIALGLLAVVGGIAYLTHL